MSIQHVVVVMLENRSYDNMLGALYSPNNAPPYNQAPPGQSDLEGLTLSGPDIDSNPNGTAADSPIIAVANQTAPTQLDGSGPEFPPTTIPLTDPGEYFSDMAQQIVSLPSVPGDGDTPYTPYPPANTELMQGFVNNYATVVSGGNSSPNVGDVMNYFTPAQVPVTSFLARNFAVCDQWFASAPTQTYTNRAFALTAAPAVSTGGSYSFIDDEQYVLESFQTTSSICEELDNVLKRVTGYSAPYWKVYFHDYSLAMKTVSYVAQAGASSQNINVSTFDTSDWGVDKTGTNNVPTGLGALPPTFVADVGNGTLPPFAFLEPRYGHTSDTYPTPPNVFPPNSNHPGGVDSLHPVGTERSLLDHDIQAGVPNPPIDVASGELFLMQVYNLLQSNQTLWNETLLIVTYDEHGGLYDHVAPPAGAAPPAQSIPSGIDIPAANDDGDKAADGFDYTVFGGRVPAILVSPLIDPGTVIRSSSPPFDHTSIVRTVWELFIAPHNPAYPSLTSRDAVAPALTGPILTGSNPAGPFGGMILWSPGTLVFSGSASQFILASASGVTLGAALLQNEPWVTISSTVAGGVLQINVTVDSSGLSDGTYTAGVLISGSGVSNSPITIPVTLTVS